MNSPLCHRVIYILQLFRDRFGGCSRTIEVDVHFIVVVSPEHLLVCHRDLIPAVLVVCRSAVRSECHRKVDHYAGLTLEDAVVSPVVRINIGCERHVPAVCRRVPCEISIIGLGSIPHLCGADILILASLCKKICVIRHVSQIIQSSFRSFSHCEILEFHLLRCLDVYDYLCCRTSEKGAEDRIVREHSVVEDNRRGAVSIFRNRIHEEVFRCSFNGKTGKMKVIVLLLLVHEVVIRRHCREISLRKSAVSYEVYIISASRRERRTLGVQGHAGSVVDIVSA